MTRAPPRTTAAHDRFVALLAVAGRGRLAAACVSQVAKALAAPFAWLPQVVDQDEACALFLAETVRGDGLPPRDLLAGLGHADGGLFMAATCDTFVTANPDHLAAARAFFATLDPLDFTVPFNGASGRSDRARP